MGVADVIRSRRLSLGLSQAELARLSGLDARQVRRYEAGEQAPSLQAAKSLALALQLSLDELAADEPASPLLGTWWIDIAIHHRPASSERAKISVSPDGKSYKAELAAGSDGILITNDWAATLRSPRMESREFVGVLLGSGAIGGFNLEPTADGGFAGIWGGTAPRMVMTYGTLALDRASAVAASAKREAFSRDRMSWE